MARFLFVAGAQETDLDGLKTRLAKMCEPSLPDDITAVLDGRPDFSGCDKSDMLLWLLRRNQRQGVERTCVRALRKEMRIGTPDLVFALREAAAAGWIHKPRQHWVITEKGLAHIARLDENPGAE